jgi:multimeric flavodoxin WrbA
MSKSYPLVQLAEEVFTAAGGFEIEVLELHRLVSEYGRTIHPCKACFSTSPALCHWPCSCYPNYSLGQVHDWMNDIYPMWVRAHGVMIVTPVNWYQVSSPLKLMMDRLVCADGGNPDPTLTRGKDAQRAKEIELAGWDYPRHLAGRLFSVVVHGDVEGAENVRRSVADWLRYMHLIPAGPLAELDRYIGYWQPYATSHGALDADKAIQEEVRNAARTLLEAVQGLRAGRRLTAGTELKQPHRNSAPRRSARRLMLTRKASRFPRCSVRSASVQPCPRRSRYASRTSGRKRASSIQRSGAYTSTGAVAGIYVQGASAAAFRPEMRPNARHSPMFPVPWYK